MFEMRCRENDIEHRFTKINHPWTTDEIEQPFFQTGMLSSPCAWATAWRRAGPEVKALPRSLYRRSSFAAPVRTLGPCWVQPLTSRS
jgi:hypothetical protein